MSQGRGKGIDAGHGANTLLQGKCRWQRDEAQDRATSVLWLSPSRRHLLHGPADTMNGVEFADLTCNGYEGLRGQGVDLGGMRVPPRAR